MEWKIVRLKEYDEVPFGAIRALMNNTSSQERQLSFPQAQPIRQCVDIIFKSAYLFVGMKVLGKSDRVVYFPQGVQSNLLSQQVKRLCRNMNKSIHVALRNVIRMTMNGGVYLTGE